VLAIEPDPWLSGLLGRSAGLNGGSGCVVEVLQAAIGERAEDVVLNIAARGRATNFVSGHVPSTQTGGVRTAVGVRGLTLDGLLEGRVEPTLLKIDVEGAELAVLRGARQLLREVRPRILCEVSHESREEVTGILRESGYVLYDAERPWPEAGPIAACAWNTVAIPEPAR
jgi:FkbM family methyltransferase